MQGGLAPALACARTWRHGRPRSPARRQQEAVNAVFKTLKDTPFRMQAQPRPRVPPRLRGRSLEPPRSISGAPARRGTRLRQIPRPVPIGHAGSRGTRRGIQLQPRPGRGLSRGRDGQKLAAEGGLGRMGLRLECVDVSSCGAGERDAAHGVLGTKLPDDQEAAHQPRAVAVPHLSPRPLVQPFAVPAVGARLHQPATRRGRPL